jgi:hypothetical protein
MLGRIPKGDAPFAGKLETAPLISSRTELTNLDRLG